MPPLSPLTIFPGWIFDDFFFATEAGGELERRAGGSFVQNLTHTYTLTTDEQTYLAGLGVNTAPLLAAMNARHDRRHSERAELRRALRRVQREDQVTGLDAAHEDRPPRPRLARVGVRGDGRERGQERSARAGVHDRRRDTAPSLPPRTSRPSRRSTSGWRPVTSRRRPTSRRRWASTPASCLRPGSSHSGKLRMAPHSAGPCVLSERLGCSGWTRQRGIARGSNSRGSPLSLSGESRTDFWKFWAGQTISQLGSSFTAFALPLLVYKLTGSSVSLAVGTAAYFSLPPLRARHRRLGRPRRPQANDDRGRPRPRPRHRGDPDPRVRGRAVGLVDLRRRVRDLDAHDRIRLWDSSPPCPTSSPRTTSSRPTAASRRATRER